MSFNSTKWVLKNIHRIERNHSNNNTFYQRVVLGVTNYTFQSTSHIVLCFCFVFLSLVYPMLPVSLDCPFFDCPFGIL